LVPNLRATELVAFSHQPGNFDRRDGGLKEFDRTSEKNTSVLSLVVDEGFPRVGVASVIVSGHITPTHLAGLAGSRIAPSLNVC
jgi:hypothetical protein